MVGRKQGPMPIWRLGLIRGSGCWFKMQMRVAWGDRGNGIRLAQMMVLIWSCPISSL